MKRKLLFAAALVAGALGFNANAQTKKDVTSDYLQNPSFEFSAENTKLTGNIKASNAQTLSIYGWTQNLNGINNYNNTEVVNNTTAGTSSKHGAVKSADSDYHLYFRKGWSDNATPDVSFTSNAFNLPAGQYEITCSYILEECNRISNLTKGSYLTVKISDGDTDIATGKVNAHYYGSAVNDGNVDNIKYTDEWNTLTIAFKLEESKNVSIAAILTPRGGVNTELSLDKFVINEVTIENKATVDDYTNLQNAIDNIEENLGFDEGDYAPFDVFNTLVKAKAITSDIDNPKDVVVGLIDDLESLVANKTEVNAVYDGTFVKAQNSGAPIGWTMSDDVLGGATHSRVFNPDARLSEFNETNSGFFVRFDGNYSTKGSMYYYGRTEGYTMPLKADTYYTVSFDFTNWADNGSAEAPLRLNVSGPEGFEAVYKTVNTTKNAVLTSNTETEKMVITFKTANAGNYVINLQNPGASISHNVVVSNITLKRTPIVTIDEEEAYTPSNATADVVELKRTIKEGINTIVLPFDVKDVEGVFGEGSTVYVVNSYADGNISFEKSANGIEANVPCLLDAANATDGKGTYTFENVTLKSATELKSDDVDGVQLVGIYSTTDVPQDANSYVVSDGALYFVDSKVNIKATRAYFTVEGASEAGVKSISMSFGDDATGIVNVVESEAKSGKIYDLQGREVKNPARGIYIIDGKKVFLNK